VEFFKDIRLGMLYDRFIQNQNAGAIPEGVKKRHADGLFRRIKSLDIPTLIRLGDRGVAGYLVPGKLVDESLMHCKMLEEWADKYGPCLPKELDKKRGLTCVRHYQRWIKYQAKGTEAPKISGDYMKDGKIAEDFFVRTKFLWTEARKWFPKHHCCRIYRDQSIIKGVAKGLCDLWMGCAVNISVDRPVETSPHRDLKGFERGFSVLSAFGSFSGGALILWELEAVVELKAGDLFYFRDNLINHSNEEAHGRRHSVVAFTDAEVWKWVKKEIGLRDDRSDRLKARRMAYCMRGAEQDQSEKISGVGGIGAGLRRV